LGADVFLSDTAMTNTSKTHDEKRDAILKRMLKTPHRPHTPLQRKSMQKLTTGKGRVRVGKSRS
jgi:hypothetical protein